MPLSAEPDDLVEAFARSPARWLPPPADGRGPGHWSATLRAGPIARVGTCGVGETADDGDGTHHRRLVWQADPEPETSERALPALRGVLALRIVGRGGDLSIEGGYDPPTGPIGASLGPQQVQAMAEAAATGLIHDVATRLVDDAD
jgi:hypothetical protein